MVVLLDTHVLLWWLFNDKQLSYRARELIQTRDNDVLVSSASGWEIATKHRIGKLPEAANVVSELPALLIRARMQSLVITLEDALLAGAMRSSHRDPFDRMSAAQGLSRDIPVITNDPAISGFDVETIW